jgi:predicted  nucleic acid-binding Zn-ribbon protein
MSDHIPDLTKMIGDTPRTDRWLRNLDGWHYVNIERARELERELNAANKRIKELEAKIAELHDLEKWLEGR